MSRGIIPWDEMCWLRVSNPTLEPVTVRATSAVAVPPERSTIIPPGKQISMNMQFATTIEIGGLVIGPMTSPNPNTIPQDGR